MLENKKGVSLIALVLALALLSTFALLAIWLLAGHSNITSTFWKAQQAFYIADAGLRVNAEKLQDNWGGWNIPSNFPDLSFAGGTISVVITDDDDGDSNSNFDSNGKLLVRATGTLDDVSRTLQADVTYSVPALDCVVYTTEEITVQGAANVVGQQVQNAPSLPLLDEAAAISLAKANTSNGYNLRPDGNYFRGGFPAGSDAPDSLNGVIYVDTFEDGSPASVTLNNLSTNDGNPAFLVVMGHIHITANLTFNGLIYNGGTASFDTDITGNNTINGGILSSHDVFIRGTADILYDLAMMKNSLTTSLLTENPSNYIYEWRELH